MTVLRSPWVGLTVAVSFAAWIIVSSVAAGVSPARILGTLGVAVATYALGRRLWRHRLVAAGVVVLGVAVLLVATVTMLDVSAPIADGMIDAGPFSYENANAALAVQGAASAVMGAALAVRRSAAILFAGCAALLALMPLAIASWAGSVGGALVLTSGVAVWARWRLSSRAVAICAALIVLGAIATTVVVTAFPNDDDVAFTAVRESVTSRRVHMWTDAVAIARDHPLVGVGPGGFGSASPTARANPDTLAAHSVWLEAAAELGLPGAILLLALALWPLLQLAVGGYVSVVGVAAWTALALHATIDYVVDFWGLVAVAAFLVGLASPRPDGSDSKQLDVA